MGRGSGVLPSDFKRIREGLCQPSHCLAAKLIGSILREGRNALTKLTCFGTRSPSTTSFPEAENACYGLCAAVFFIYWTLPWRRFLHYYSMDQQDNNPGSGSPQHFHCRECSLVFKGLSHLGGGTNVLTFEFLYIFSWVLWWYVSRILVWCERETHLLGYNQFANIQRHSEKVFSFPFFW